ncbi:hypothetical protein [uncultured Salinisphaera sp.]|uniref:hypothetical protein n=1 Tax=uncultured Salinisphaera sp. TaxID=359372 RepID=UPI0032B2F0F1|tara:strand:+ start:1042 stop:1296 length:255 start_codon:yes stop_codon:yes gene_type:complete
MGNPVIDKVGNGTVQAIFHATYGFGDTQISLGEFETYEAAKNAIQAREESEIGDNQLCFDCEGRGIYKGEECNLCAGTGKLPPA